MNVTIDVYVTVRYRCNNVIDERTLNAEYEGNMKKWVDEFMLLSGNVFDLTDDGGEIVSVERIAQGESK